ncbi:MAG TPA: RNA degradosome polyphosphate kinase [Acidimicrobiia bacterium]|nr:RNA degradosome polyphosphate kinase [Acidimicrobiia bacterium]
MSDRYTNRELSWLDFNERVLAIAEDPTTPLLERTKFLAIYSSNLDEFFQVRVAGLMEQQAVGVRTVSPDGLSATDQLEMIRRRMLGLSDRQSRCFHESVAPALEEAGIAFSSYDSLDDDDRKYLDEQFRERVFPVVTPLAVDPAHPFPYISNLSLNLAVFVRNPRTGVTRFARVKVPPILPRFVVMPDGERFVSLEQVIAAHLDALFPGMEIVAHHPFRVTRNADFEIEEEEAHDLLAAIESELTRRRFGRVVRLEVEPGIPDHALELLMREMSVGPEDVYQMPGPLDMAGLFSLGALSRPDLNWPAFNWVTDRRLASVDGEPPDIFVAIRKGDLLFHHPYDSFTTSVEAFLAAAATDPDVLAIKQTLYRTSAGSPIMEALIEAANEGKQVAVLVELKARFDEERNIEWARALEEAGVHVVYGLVGLKTHTKTTLVVREEESVIRRYAHIGTGNYNDATARIYEDIGLFTTDDDIGADLSDLFNFLTGYSAQSRYRKLLVAPVELRQRILALIEREASRPDGQIVMKMNALVDVEMIEALYRASESGTRVELIVRGICCLRPGVEGMSSNITVRSIVGRYLEHSRIYRFGADQPLYYMGSADLMPRNLDRRVEALTPVEDPTLQARLDEMLDVLREDDELAWELKPDGSWVKVPTVKGIETHRRLQELAMERVSDRDG